MTQEDKQILLKDLCARAMYRPFVQLNLGAYNKPEICILTGVDCPDRVYISTDSDYYNIENIKPYLRPMSSMTEEEKKEYNHIAPGVCWVKGVHIPNVNQIDWLNKNGFDYRGLIPMELALEAPEKMYKTE